MKQHWAVLSTLLFAQAYSSSGCMCETPPPLLEEYNKADAVFVGKVTAGRFDEKGGREYKFKVMEMFKGYASTTLNIWTGWGGGDCGYDFNIGRDYLVYATFQGDQLCTIICTRTKEFHPYGRKEVEELKAELERSSAVSEKNSSND